MNSVALLKESLRTELLGRRSRMVFEDVCRLSSGVQKRFMNTPEFRRAGRLALYASFRNEVLTNEILAEAVKCGKEVCFPRVIGGNGPRIAFFRVSEKDGLSPGRYNILEPPEGGVEHAPEDFDCIVVPGVAFDLSGARLGYGKGYYDRALADVRCPVAALAFDMQVLGDGIPREGHDVGVDLIVTQTRVIRT